MFILINPEKAHNITGDYVELLATEHNPCYAPFFQHKGGKYGISSSPSHNMAYTVSHGSPSAVSSPFTALLMYCDNPGYISGLGFVPCGKCLACRISKKKEWADRLVIESKYHQYNYFVTLTYSPEHYPKDESLDPNVLKKYLKRLGYYCGKVPQYFACGEYGDEDYTERAHYHLAIFSDKDIFNEIMAAWEFGNVDIKHLCPERCRYICGYVVKKMTKGDDSRLDGRYPEFFSASRRPVLGYQFFYDFLERFVTDESFRQQMLTHAYAPYSVRISGHNISIPRYVREKLRPFYAQNEEKQAFNKSEKRNKDFQVLAQIQENLQRMYELKTGEKPDVRSKKFWSFCQHLYSERADLHKKAYDKRHKRQL